MSPGIRLAVYWAPEITDPLAAAGNGWLGRDPETGATLAQPNLPGIEDITAAPRLYGFHATLRPPMRLATGWEEAMAAAETLAARVAPFDLPDLVVADVGGFLALREAAPCPQLRRLADACVRATDPHRLVASAAELAQRREAGLSAAQDRLLLRWGYPHVMDHWTFHMTLTRRLTQAEMAAMRPAARAHFTGALRVRRRVCDIAIFTQRRQTPPAPFLIAERLSLRGGT